MGNSNTSKKSGYQCHKTHTIELYFDTLVGHQYRLLTPKKPSEWSQTTFPNLWNEFVDHCHKATTIIQKNRPRDLEHMAITPYMRNGDESLGYIVLIFLLFLLVVCLPGTRIKDWPPIISELANDIKKYNQEHQNAKKKIAHHFHELNVKYKGIISFTIKTFKLTVNRMVEISIVIKMIQPMIQMLQYTRMSIHYLWIPGQIENTLVTNAIYTNRYSVNSTCTCAENVGCIDMYWSI